MAGPSSRTLGLFEIFGACSIINLPDREDRRLEVTQEIERLGFSLADAGIKLFPAVRPDEPLGFPSKAMRGNLISHREALREGLVAGVDSILILEDDVLFKDAWTRDRSIVEKRLREADWDIAYLGHCAELGGRGPTEVLRCELDLVGAHCYAVRGRALQGFVAFLDALEKRSAGHADGGPMFIDGALNFYRRRNPELRVVHCAPALAIQRPSRTDCHVLKWHDRMPVVRWLVAKLRRFRARIASR